MRRLGPAKPLYQSDAYAFDRFHVEAWKLYQDDRRSLRPMDAEYIGDSLERLHS